MKNKKDKVFVVTGVRIDGHEFSHNINISSEVIAVCHDEADALAVKEIVQANDTSFASVDVSPSVMMDSLPEWVVAVHVCVIAPDEGMPHTTPFIVRVRTVCVDEDFDYFIHDDDSGFSAVVGARADEISGCIDLATKWVTTHHLGRKSLVDISFPEDMDIDVDFID